MASVRLEHVSKIFQSSPEKKRGLFRSGKDTSPTVIPAVNDVSAEISDGEFVVLIGPSGCGKSTILRLIAGLETPSAGEIFIDGKRVNDLEPKDRDVAMVFQNYALYPHMTVYENIAFALRQRIPSEAEIDRKVRETAELLDITPYLDRKPGQLSGGQRQRVAIGRAIVRNPKVMLMDEPLSNLDTALRTQMRAELLRLHQKLKTTFIYVTHDQTEAMTLGDRVIMMSQGEVQQIGTPREIFAHPANRFVASFIDSPGMSFFNAELTQTDRGYTVLFDGAAYDLPKDTELTVDSGPVLLGVRPEKIRISGTGHDAVLSLIEMTGVDCRVYLDFQGMDVIALVFEGDDIDVKELIGQPVGFDFVPDDIFLFDPVTGKNLSKWGGK